MIRRALTVGALVMGSAWVQGPVSDLTEDGGQRSSGGYNASVAKIQNPASAYPARTSDRLCTPSRMRSAPTTTTSPVATMNAVRRLDLLLTYSIDKTATTPMADAMPEACPDGKEKLAR